MWHRKKNRLQILGMVDQNVAVLPAAQRNFERESQWEASLSLRKREKKT